MKKALLWIFYLFVFVSISAQKIAVKTNILYDVTTTLNIGAEFRVVSILFSALTHIIHKPTFAP